MSIMERMRAGSDSTGMQIVMAAVVVSFVFWYGQPMGDTASIVAEVNGTRIMDTEFRRKYRTDERNLENRYGRTLSDPEKQGLAEQVKNALVQEEVLIQEAERLGLEVSQAEMAEFVAGIPAFQDEEGVFDRQMMERYLKRQRMTYADFEVDVRRMLLRNKLEMLVYMGATLSEPVVRELYIEGNTKLDIRYVRVRPTAFYDDLDIAPADVQAWLTENADKAKEIYERDFDRLYSHPEQVKLSMIRLPIRQDGLGAAELIPKLRAVKEEIEGGADFAEVARRWSEDESAEEGGSIGLQAVPELDPDVAETLEKTEVGDLSDVVATDRDVRLYRLEERVESQVDPFEEVQEQIAEQALREQRAPVRAAEVAEQLLEQWKQEGSVPQDLLDENDLSSQTTGLVLASGQDLGFLNAPPRSLLKAASLAEQGEVLDEVFQESGILWVAMLEERQDADLSTFELEKDQIHEQALMTRRDEFFTAWRDDVVAKAEVKIY